MVMDITRYGAIRILAALSSNQGVEYCRQMIRCLNDTDRREQVRLHQ